MNVGEVKADNLNKILEKTFMLISCVIVANYVENPQLLIIIEDRRNDMEKFLIKK